MTIRIGMKPVRPTRFAELGYIQIMPGLWRVACMEDGATVGPHYRTKDELLADLERYATEYGATLRG